MGRTHFTGKDVWFGGRAGCDFVLTLFMSLSTNLLSCLYLIPGCDISTSPQQIFTSFFIYCISTHTHTLWAALPSLVILNLSLISPSDSCLVDSSSKHQIRPSSQTSLSLLPLTLLFSNWEQTTLHTDRNPPVRWFQSELCWSPAAEEWKVFGTVWWDRKCLRYEIHDRTWQSLTCRELFDKCNVF